MTAGDWLLPSQVQSADSRPAALTELLVSFMLPICGCCFAAGAAGLPAVRGGLLPPCPGPPGGRCPPPGGLPPGGRCPPPGGHVTLRPLSASGWSFTRRSISSASGWSITGRSISWGRLPGGRCPPPPPGGRRPPPRG
ncbi:MAG UNVERIFIED_CONTAM: hypothetical protein LVR18_50955 [Planctomycetaceae bacterium]